MEWDFKDFGGWDSSDEKEEDSDLAALVGSSSISEQQLHRNGSPAAASLKVDLKLATDDSSGHVYDQNGPIDNLLKDPIKPSTSRSKVVNNDNHQKASCLVDGCRADLSRCREYHRRHRVCELHSKTPVVVLRGEQKRFCQQCSRFHSLLEFDEVKRSCRKRLNGHNQRRRKPKPESLYFSPNFLSSYKGPRILQFGNPQLCATSNMRGMWPVEAKNGAETMLYNRHPPWLNATGCKRSPPNSFSIGGGGDKPFLFLQTNDDHKSASTGKRAAPQALMSQQQPFLTSETRKGGHIMSCDGMTRVIDSGCALYLLSSSHPTQNQNPVTGLIQSNVATRHQGQEVGFSEFSYSNDVQEDDKPVSPEMVLLMGADGFFDNGAQMLPIVE